MVLQDKNEQCQLENNTNKPTSSPKVNQPLLFEYVVRIDIILAQAFTKLCIYMTSISNGEAVMEQNGNSNWYKQVRLYVALCDHNN